MYICPRCAHRQAEGPLACKCGTAYLVDEADLARAPGDPLLGRVLQQRYAVLARLGQGTLGPTYRALSTRLLEAVAVKAIRDEGVGLPKAEREAMGLRFALETTAIARLSHPHTAQILDYGQEPDGVRYLVHEYTAGRSLQELLRSGALPVLRALNMLHSVAGAMAEAHRRQVLHGDLKPANVIVRSMEGVPDFVKVLDAGIARIIAGDREAVAVLSSQSSPGPMLGAAEYLAPEQAYGSAYAASVDHRADVYALGTIAFQMLAGRLPFNGSPSFVMQQKQRADAPKLSAVRPDLKLSPLLQETIARALARDPAARCADMPSFMAMIDEARWELQVREPERDRGFVLVALNGEAGRRFPLAPGLNLVGRRDEMEGVEPEVDLQDIQGLAGAGVSRRHCELVQRGESWSVHDLGSVNGTFINDDRIPAGSERPIPVDADLRVGALVLRLERDA